MRDDKYPILGVHALNGTAIAVPIFCFLKLFEIKFQLHP